MAIINTLQKCLDSPYLFEDKEAPNRIVDLLAKAGDRLEAAVNIHTSGQGDPADIVFLSYEAMFSCVRALVYAKCTTCHEIHNPLAVGLRIRSPRLRWRLGVALERRARWGRERRQHRVGRRRCRRE